MSRLASRVILASMTVMGIAAVGCGGGGDPVVVVSGTAMVHPGSTTTLTATTINGDDSSYVWVTGDSSIATVDESGVVTGVAVGEAAITYGNFIQAIVNFVIIALVIFLIVRSFNKLQESKEAEAAAAPPTPSPEETLLTEIRDILQEKN